MTIAEIDGDSGYDNSKACLKLRKATLTLSAIHKFQHYRALGGGGDPCDPVRRLRAGAYVIRAAQRFKLAGSGEAYGPNFQLTLQIAESKPVPVNTLQRLLQEKSLTLLRDLGGLPGLAASLLTDLAEGLSNNNSNNDELGLEKRREIYGANSYPNKPVKPFWHYVWEATQDTTLIVLMVCAVLSIVFGIKSHGAAEGWYEGSSIGFAILLVIAITAVSDYRQSFQFRTLDDKKKNIQLQVIRDRRRVPVSIFDLVVGDVVPLNTGDAVPADGVLIQGHSLTVNEASLTGESEPVHVDRSNPFLLSGCKVSSGTGTMLVTGVGTNTQWGNIMSTISQDTMPDTPLQARLGGLATFIGKVGLIVAFLVLVVLVVFYFIGRSTTSSDLARFEAGNKSANDIVNNLIEILSIAITIIVVAVPEGLPLAVTLTLAYSMKKMMADQALVRRLSACETMGSATAICTDKTGTLTLNQMSVVECWMAGRLQFAAKSESGDAPKWLLEGIALNSSGSVFILADGAPPDVTGNPTEKAALNWGLKLGMDYNHLHQTMSVVGMQVFNSDIKRMGVAVQSGGAVRVHWKGAAEIILGLCTKFSAAGGQGDEAMSELMRSEIHETIDRMAANSLRCIAFAYRPLKPTEQVPRNDDNWKLPEDELSLLAIVGIKDSCRSGVPEAILTCQRAGISVRMVTGDNIVTAVAIAKECGILTHDESLNPLSVAVEGIRFRNWSKEERMTALSSLKVMARSSPNDKLLMVRTLQEMGEIVAVTGDGTNDAPALHEADVGLAMGIEGTEVAKDSSDIVILDDNFKSVVRVVRWGRSVYANIQKFLQFQLTVNVAALTVNFVAAVSKGNVPLTVVQLLWVNLIMDSLGALALATESPTNELMHRPPVGLHEPLITNIMWRNIFGQAAYQIAVLLTLQFKGMQILKIQDHTKLNTIIFNSFVLCQVFNEVNARRPTRLNIFEGLHKSRLFLGIIGITLMLQVIIVEFLQKFASTTNLRWDQWLICVAIGSLSWPIAVVLKFIPVPKRHFLNTNGRLRRHQRQRLSSATVDQLADTTKID